MTDAWTSKRLLFRGILFPEDEGFLMELTGDSFGQAMAFPGLLRPPERTSLDGFKKYLESNLLSVMICVPTEKGEDPQTAANAAKAGSFDAYASKIKSEYTEIGTITLSAPPPVIGSRHRHTTIGIHIASGFRGKGYGREAIDWITQWAFLHAGMHRVEIGAFSFNEIACRLYEKMGFIVEGRKRDFLWYNGGWHDMVEMSILEHEWHEREKKRKEGSGEA